MLFRSREPAIACQIHSYLSINTTYTHLQPHNKLSILQKSKIQEILLENPYFYAHMLGNDCIGLPSGGVAVPLRCALYACPVNQNTPVYCPGSLSHRHPGALPGHHCQSTTLHIKLRTFLMHLQCISNASLKLFHIL